MAREPVKPQLEASKLPTLQMPRSEAEQRIRRQIEKGEQLLTLQIPDFTALEYAYGEMRKWADYNDELSRRIVDTDDLYRSLHPIVGHFPTTGERLDFQIQRFYSEARERLSRLVSILDRLELIPEQVSDRLSIRPQEISELSNRVFVVHGHDEEAKQSVARCIERLGLQPIILHEQPSQGRTIIEKFEDYADVGFAVVLLTPDDVGAAKEQRDDLQPRARQNVILELGYFLDAGRNRVCALCKGDIEIPTDYKGVIWVEMDPAGVWRFRLGPEMKAVGFDLDSNVLM